MATLLLLMTVGGVGLLVMSSDERMRLVHGLGRLWLIVKEEATRSDPDEERFRIALRHRTRHLVLTPALVAAHVSVFGLALLADPQQVLGRAANLASRTTNGEWWRLLTSLFVHSGMMPLLIDVGAIAVAGAVLERLAGRLLCACVFGAAGVLASIVAMSAYPIDESMGASGAICGWVGLLIAAWLWGSRRASEERIPTRIAVRLAVLLGIFLVSSVARVDVPLVADLTGLAVGLVSGGVLTRRLHESVPPVRSVALVAAAAVALAAVLAFPLRGLTDIRPEIATLISLEDRTAATYQTAAEQLKKGRATVNSLVELIERTIVPKLEAAETRLNAVRGVPPVQQTLAVDAHRYLRLRAESWRLRAEGLRKTSTPMSDASRTRIEAQYRKNRILFGKAEAAERASLEALARIR